MPNKPTKSKRREAQEELLLQVRTHRLLLALAEAAPEEFSETADVAAQEQDIKSKYDGLAAAIAETG